MPSRVQTTKGPRLNTRLPKTPPAPASTGKTLTAFPFPQELVDLVVDNLEDDISSLEACSLTSRAFLASSRRYQFSEIELLGLPKSDQPETRAQKQTLCDKFHALITNSPHIAPLVKGLTIEEGDEGWLTKRSPLPLVLRQLVNLEDISVGQGGHDIVWSKLPHRVRESLLDIIHSPKLESVTLMSIEELPHPSKLFPVVEGSSLYHIMLLGVTFEDETGNSAGSPLSFPLEALELALFGEQLVVLLGYFKDMLPTLQSLSMMLADVDDFSPAWECIERSTALGDLGITMLWSASKQTCTKFVDFRLTYILLVLGFNGTSEERFPNLKGHSELESIRFGMNLAGLAGQDIWDTPLTWIADVLDTLRPGTPLTEIVIAVEVSFQERMRPFQLLAWSRMDALLTSPAFMLDPCQITVKLVPTCHGSANIEVYETLRRRILMGLPRLLSKNLVDIECMSLTFSCGILD